MRPTDQEQGSGPRRPWVRVVAVVGGALAALPMIAFVAAGFVGDQSRPQPPQPSASTTRCAP
nr:hypothetical protein [Kibdelosporangium sp. MJ126-NF4]